MGRVCTGGKVAGMAVMPAHPCHCRFCIVFLWEWVYWQWEGWWQKSGLVRTLQKKGPLTLRGKATEGNTLGSMALGTGEIWDNTGGGGIADMEGPAGGGGAADMEGPAGGGGADVEEPAGVLRCSGLAIRRFEHSA